jgi:hypothetical protein
MTNWPSPDFPEETGPIPQVPEGYRVEVICQLDLKWSDRLSRLTRESTGIYFACGDFVSHIQARRKWPPSYAWLQNDSFIHALIFDRNSNLFVATSERTVYQIYPNKGGRICSRKPRDGALLTDLCLFPDDTTLLVSDFHSGIYSISLTRPGGEWSLLSANVGTRGMTIAKGHLWTVEPEAGLIAKRSLDGKEVSKFRILSDHDFHCPERGYDAQLAMDGAENFYVTAGAAGTVLRLNPTTGDVEVFVSGLLNPTGVSASVNGTLYVLEAGRARVLEVQNLRVLNTKA